MYHNHSKLLTKHPVLKSILFVLCFLLGYGKSYSQYDNILNKTYAERSPHLYHYYTDTLCNIPDGDSARIFQKIDYIEKLALQHNDEELALEMELLRIHYFFYRPRFDRTLVLAKAEKLRIVAERKKLKWLMARVESLFALTYFDPGYNYELAFVHFQKLYNNLSTMTSKEFPEKGACLYQIGMAYYFFSDYNSAIKYLEECIRDDSPSDMHNFTTQSCNVLGACYQKMKQYDLSNHYFEQSYQHIKDGSPLKRIWLGISSGNIGYNYYLQTQFAKAKPLMQLDVEIAIEYKDWGLASGSLICLADMAIMDKNFTEAEQLLSKAQSFIQLSGQYKHYGTLYTILAKLEAHKGNPERVDMLIDSALIVKDSLARKYNSLHILRAMQQVELERHSRLESEAKLKTFEIRMLIAIAILVIGIFIRISYLQREKAKRQKEALDRTNHELEEATKELNRFTGKIQENNAIIETLKQQLGDNDRGALMQLKQATILTEEDWETFRLLFDKVHFGYLHRLKGKFPLLTPSETRFLALSKLNLSNREMAATLGVGFDAIRQTRSRLRKKLNLTNEDLMALPESI